MQLLLVIVLLGALLGCGVDELSARLSAAQGSFGGEVRPPQEYYRALLVARFNNSSANKRSHGKVFLNFSGGEVSRGFNKRESFLICNKKHAVISPAALGHEQRIGIYDELAEFFTAERVPLDLVMDEPHEGDYSTVHIGGWHHSLGCRAQPVLGAAPSDHGDVNPADVGFVFNTEPALLPAAIGHVVGRMIGLPLEHRADDTIMRQHVDSHTELVLNEQARQVLRTQHTAAARIAADDLPGSMFFAAMDTVLDDLEHDEVLDISALQTELEHIVPDTVKLPGLARGLTAIHALGLDDHDFKKSGKWGKVKDVIGDVFKEAVIETVKRPYDVQSNIITAIAKALGGTLGKNKKKRNDRQERHLTTLPDLTILLELDEVSETHQLFPPLRAQRQVLKRDYHGGDYDSMHSLLKVGYFQRLAELP